MKNSNGISSIKATAAVLTIGVVLLAASTILAPARAASGTVSFTCLQQSQALALINANPPAAMWPDGTHETQTCPGMYDGYYTGAATTTTTSVPTPITVEGTGVQTNRGTNTVAFIPATGCTTGTGTTCVQSCNGPTFTAAPTINATSTPSLTTAPYLYTSQGSNQLTGVITSNTPGVAVNHAVVSPCGATPPVSSVSTDRVVVTYSNVTINPPNGNPVTGGLIVTTFFTSTTAGNPGVSVTSTNLPFWTLTGTGGLAGMTGIGQAVGTAVTIPGKGTATTVYWVHLDNVP